MRALMTCTSGEGHIGPLLPFADATRRAGGQVAFATSGPAAAAAQAAGYEVLEVASAPPSRREPWFARARREPEGNVNSHVVREVFAGVDTQAALPGLLAACRRWQPDLVVHESCEFAAVLAAELRGLPRVRVAIGTAVTERVILAAAATPLAARRREVGLPPEADGRQLTATSLTLAPAPLEDPDVPELADSRRFRARTPTARPLPDWWPGDDRPLVYLTFGTVAGGSELFPDLYRTAAQAIATLPVRVLIAVGRDADPVALGPLAPNVRARRWVRQTDVLAHATVVACHAGSGTCAHALAAGVPLAMLPLFADQPHNAKRVTALGAGIAVPAGPRAGAGLAHATAQALADSRYRAAASAAAQEIRRSPLPYEAVSLLEHAARGSPVQRS